ncbi:MULTISPECIES: phytoene/squalene synthase family protein [Halolamina]|uniref:Phytoene synthase n=1 Tax=Halolamina pelagica TaxID=699431 RepID=A0A1I5Q010_9EURY|nr:MULTISPECIES: phytoene/squalene synthase family protein [Halolamina]NHX35025.1 phytoene/squalene synthase family protein [Halolamina sp. R1-12]SFP39360.1 phytoene synthase [Halolamina pelagica]
MVEQRQLARSKRIHRETGKTFYVATRFLPERVRHPTYVLYAFFRVADEVVDGDNDLDPEERTERLESFRRAALGQEPTDDPVLAAFAEIRERHDIPESDVNTFVDAMATDVEKARYETYGELREYMDGSAAAVGRMMTAVMAPDRAEAALPAATALGEAFQLTNFVRDVREDVIERDRIYLPAETLEAHGASHEQIARLEFDENVADAVRAELTRAEALYRDGVAGIELLPKDCQFPVLLAAILYADHHRLIRDRDYDVVSATPSLSTPRKLWLAARARLAWWRNPDPLAVFRSVSAVPSDETDHRLQRATGRLPVP